eukprot:gnl/TRDRNA2_/TRDRNA2_64397_c0_seq1.p2 gnl/TRDRNA2_/TRDRNA2_64397_c0~~gnl/TRDRNA2_/TRDRNA2_64397_c0_seq1.p2  ORF type:complete len:101 (-),score=21.56 gnl/TRDRNA2_/TRDRNA2_64397_c0_seq1:373-675(-)
MGASAEVEELNPYDRIAELEAQLAATAQENVELRDQLCVQTTDAGTQTEIIAAGQVEGLRMQLATAKSRIEELNEVVKHRDTKIVELESGYLHVHKQILQ